MQKRIKSTTSMKKKYSSLLLRCLLPGGKKLMALHQALFGYFLPYQGNDAAIAAAIARSRDNTYTLMRSNIPVMWIMLLIARPGWLLQKGLITWYYRRVEQLPVPVNDINAAVTALRGFFRETGTDNFIRMNETQRRRFMQLLTNAPLNFYRRIGAGLRVFYFVNAYKGNVGRLIAGIGDFKEDAFIPDTSLPLPDFSTPLRYNARQQCIAGEIDAIIIGSGPAGCMVASEMHRAGKKVLMLEAGSFFMPGTFDGRAGLQFYEDKGFRTTSNGSVFVLNGSVVGGGATVNVDMAFEPVIASVAARFDKWHAEKTISPDIWTTAQLQAASAAVQRTLHTRPVQAEEMNTHNSILFEGSKAHGRQPSYYALNTWAPGESPYPRTDKRGPVEHYILHAMQDKHNPLTLIPDAAVEKIIVRNGKAEGVQLMVHAPDMLPGIVGDPFGLQLPHNKVITVKAKEVIVAGGNLGSSVLLKKSGIPGEMIGRGFVMHPFMLVLGLFDELIDNHIGTQSSVYVGDYLTTDHRNPQPDFMLESASARPEIGAMLMPGCPAQVLSLISRYRHIGGFGVLLIDEVNPDNRVDVLPDGTPDIHYHLSETDIERFRFGVLEAVRIMFRGGARKVIIPSFEPLCGNALEDDGFNIMEDMEAAEAMISRLHFTPNETPLFAAHMMGGLKMHSSRHKGCIDQDYQVYGVEGLYVVDSSVYPSSVGANPMQTIYATAKIFAERHLHQHQPAAPHRQKASI